MMYRYRRVSSPAEAILGDEPGAHLPGVSVVYALQRVISPSLYFFDGSGDIRYFIDFFKGATEGLKGFFTVPWIIL
jgi:hypothetical protein